MEPSNKRRCLLWAGAIAWPVLSLLAFAGALAATWMNAVGSWSVQRTALVVYPCVVLSTVLFGMFVWCAWRLSRA